MAAAQIAPIAQDFHVAGVPVSLFGLQMAALTLAISLDRIFDGFGRPFFGYVSDNIGRENTMFIAFSTAALAVIVLLTYGHHPMVFVFATAVYFGVFGEIYSLFPATCGTRSDPNTPPAMPACSTPPRAPRRSWCRSPASCRRPMGGRRCSR